MWKKHWQMVSTYSVAHFAVDFACAFLMFRVLSHSSDWLYCVLIYNFCAFAMQMPLGIIADRLNRNSLFAAAGCILIVLAYGLTSIPFLATVVIGIGNGMFHIGGGIDVLNISEKKSSALGVFVSPGAFGIYFGTLLGKGNQMAAPLILLVLLAMAGLILIMRKVKSATYKDNATFLPQFPKLILTAALMLFLVVALRSFAGLAAEFPWKGIGQWGLALVCATALGKACGGFLSDWLGPAKAAIVSLGVSMLLFLFPEIPLVGVAAVFLFNMTMPITLWVMARLFPAAKGFSFGLLTFALFLGFVPVYLEVSFPTSLLPPVAAVSLLLLLIGLRLSKQDQQEQNHSE